MAELKLFKLGNDVQELKSSSATIEKELQNIIEKNMYEFFGVKFLQSEYRIDNGRMDSIGMDENNCPVIFEYKCHSNENVINQGLFYLNWLLEHKANFKLLVIEKLGIEEFNMQSFPTHFFDVFGKEGHPVRTTISEMGPTLLARILELTEVQTGVLTIVFRIADDNGWILEDLKDLRAMVRYVGDHAKEYATEYGNIAKASIGAVQRALLQLEDLSDMAEPE